jgi:hypothetical protein
MAVWADNIADGSMKKKRIFVFAAYGMGVAQAWAEIERQTELRSAILTMRAARQAMTMIIALPKQPTLGDLIAALSEQVSPLTRSAAQTNILVSCIVKDLFAKRRIRLKKRRLLKIA